MKISIPLRQDSHNSNPYGQFLEVEDGHDGQVIVHITGSNREVSVGTKQLLTALEALERLQ